MAAVLQAGRRAAHFMNRAPSAKEGGGSRVACAGTVPAVLGWIFLLQVQSLLHNRKWSAEVPCLKIGSSETKISTKCLIFRRTMACTGIR